jgi:hypothetical protein
MVFPNVLADVYDATSTAEIPQHLDDPFLKVASISQWALVVRLAG